MWMKVILELDNEKNYLKKKIAPLVDENERKKDPKPIFKMACLRYCIQGYFCPV